MTRFSLLLVLVLLLCLVPLPVLGGPLPANSPDCNEDGIVDYHDLIITIEACKGPRTTPRYVDVFEFAQHWYQPMPQVIVTPTPTPTPTYPLFLNLPPPQLEFVRLEAKESSGDYCYHFKVVNWREFPEALFAHTGEQQNPNGFPGDSGDSRTIVALYSSVTNTFLGMSCNVYSASTFAVFSPAWFRNESKVGSVDLRLSDIISDVNYISNSVDIPPPPTPVPQPFVKIATDRDDASGTNFKEVWSRLGPERFDLRIRFYRWSETELRSRRLYVCMNTDGNRSTGHQYSWGVPLYDNFGLDFKGVQMHEGVYWEQKGLYEGQGTFSEFNAVGSTIGEIGCQVAFLYDEESEFVQLSFSMQDLHRPEAIELYLVLTTWDDDDFVDVSPDTPGVLRSQ